MFFVHKSLSEDQETYHTGGVSADCSKLNKFESWTNTDPFPNPSLLNVGNQYVRNCAAGLI